MPATRRSDMEAAMNFCGECGAPLDARDRARGTCPACGAALDPSPPFEVPIAPASRPVPSWATSFGQTATRPGWRRFALIGVAALLVLGVAVALLFATRGLWGGAGTPPTAHGAGGGGGASATQTMAASPASGHASPSASPLGASATSTPGSGPASTATPSPSPNPDITVTATTLATLSVNPIQINAGICATKSVSFTVSNRGGGSFNWTATASIPAYVVSPASGSLSGGQQTTVIVAGIVKSGSVTVSADGVQGSPQTVTITCTGIV